MKTLTLYIGVHSFLCFLAGTPSAETKELTCYKCSHQCAKQTQEKCDPEYDMCVDARYNDGSMDKGCANEKRYQNVWKKWSDSHGGNKGDPVKCYENLCNNGTIEGNLTCYSCNHNCETQKEQKCERQYDICVDVRYNDGQMDKACANEWKFQKNGNKWGDSHGGNKDDPVKCYENLCNNGTIEGNLTCYTCNHNCEKQTEQKCERQYDICVDVRYNDGEMDKACANKWKFEKTGNRWSDSHGGNKGDPVTCYENLCNNGTIEGNLTCYSCNHNCETQKEQKCERQYDMCVDVRYNDGQMDKACANQWKFEKNGNKWSDSHGGNKSDPVKCYENLCNNGTIEGNLTCYSCNHYCGKQNEQKCRWDDDMCVDVRYNDGQRDKGCANEYKYETTWKRHSDSHGGNDGDVIKCRENLCNNRTKEGNLTCYLCNQYCNKEEEQKCEWDDDMCVDVRYNDGRMDKGCANEYKYKTTWKRYSDSHDGIKGDVIKCHENLCNRKPAKVKELTCYSCDYLCTDETTKKCEPENDMCIDIRYKDGRVFKGCSNENQYQTLWNLVSQVSNATSDNAQHLSDVYNGFAGSAHKCYENLCNNKTTSCYTCTLSCVKQIKLRCPPNFDMCVDIRYNDGTLDKGCTNETVFNTVWKRISKSHGGIKGDAQKCGETLCNNNSVEPATTVKSPAEISYSASINVGASKNE